MIRSFVRSVTGIEECVGGIRGHRQQLKAKAWGSDFLVQILALPFISSVTLGNLFTLSLPRSFIYEVYLLVLFQYLPSQSYYRAFLRWNTQNQVYRKHSMNVCYSYRCTLLLFLICATGKGRKLKIHFHNCLEWSAYALVPLKQAKLCIVCVVQPRGPGSYKTTYS